MSILCSIPVERARDVSPVESELRSSVKDEVAILSSPSLIVVMVSVDVKQH